MTAPATPLLDYALRYASVWPIFPCIGSHGIAKKRKSPLTENGFHDATQDEAQIVRWFTDYPGALIGAPMGKVNGIVVVDLDRKKGHDGVASFAKLTGSPDLPMTPTAHTATGGLHLYYALDDHDIAPSIGALGDGIDVRSTGSYVILPSPGSGYQWDDVKKFRTMKPLPAPDWLLPKKVEPGEIEVTPTEHWLATIAGVSEGGRNDALTRLCGHLLRRHIDVELALGLLRAVNATACRPPLDDAEVVTIVKSIGRAELRRRAEEQ